MLRFHDNSQALRAYVKEQTGTTVLLSFSAGKDSIAAWIALREAGFEKIVPYYYRMIPEGLEFIERELEYYEDVFSTKIHRVTNPHFYGMLKSLVYQPPERWPAIGALGVREPKHQAIEDNLRTRFNLPNVYTAIGVRVQDGLTRRLSIQKSGPLNPNRKSFQAVYDWTTKDVIAALDRHSIKLPVDYQLFGRSFDGLQYTYLKPVREHFPEDYQRIVNWFPLIDLEFFRRGEL